MVVATSTAKTYMILLYQSIEWTTGDASGGNDGLGGIPASAGASSGSGDGSVTLQGSGTSSVLQLPTLTNNGEPGVFVFRIDTTNDMNINFFQPPCHPGTNSAIECSTSPSYPDAKQVLTEQQQKESEMLDRQQQEQERMVKEIELLLEQLHSTSLTSRQGTEH